MDEFGLLAVEPVSFLMFRRVPAHCSVVISPCSAVCLQGAFLCLLGIRLDFLLPFGLLEAAKMNGSMPSVILLLNMLTPPSSCWRRMDVLRMLQLFDSDFHIDVFSPLSELYVLRADSFLFFPSFLGLDTVSTR